MRNDYKSWAGDDLFVCFFGGGSLSEAELEFLSSYCTMHMEDMMT